MIRIRYSLKKFGLTLLLIFYLGGVLAQNQCVTHPGGPENSHATDILIVYSCSPNVPRAIFFSSGFRSYFQQTGVDIHVSEFFLDNLSQYNNIERKTTLLQDYLEAGGLDSTKIGAVVFADVESAEVSRRINPGLLDNIPVIYNDDVSFISGENQKKIATIGSTNYVSNYLLGKKLFPNTRNVLIITDQSLAGKIQRERARKQLAFCEGETNILFLPEAGVTLEELQKEMENLPLETFVILSDFEIDKDGRYVDFKEDISQFLLMNKFPVFGMAFEVLGKNVIGGYLSDHRSQGDKAGLLVDRILKGDVISLIPDTIENTQLMFDKQILDRWNLTTDMLPPGSEMTEDTAGQKNILSVIIWTLSGIAAVLLLLLAIQLLYKRSGRGKKRRPDSFTRKQQEMINLSFSAIDEGIILLDLNYQVVEINATAKNLLNINNEIIGKAFDEFVEIVIPDSKEDDDEGELWKMMNHVLSTGKRVEITIDMHLITADGPVLHVVGAISPVIDQNNEHKGIVMSFRDATDYFKRKQQLTQTIEVARSFYWHYNIDEDRFVYDVGFNEVCSFSDEFKTLDQVISHLEPGCRERFRMQFEHIIHGDQDVFCIEYGIDFQLSREYVFWESRGVLEKSNQDGQIVRLIMGVSYNVESHKAKETDLLAATRKAEDSDLMKSSFLANMSHEIRTPLNSIVGFVNLLTEDTFSMEDKGLFVKIVDENSKLLLNLLSDILDLSKIESNIMPFNIRPCYVDGLINNILAAYALDRSQKVIIRAEMPDEDIRIMTDPTRLTQVLNNLINNALKFTTEGEIVIAYHKTANGLEFSVKDTGKGISEEHLSQIFTQFFKGYDYLQGTGLGLSISKSIVERLGGTMLVESKLGMGTAFYFTITDQEVSGEEIPDEQIESKVYASETRIISDTVNRSILVAEDTDSNFYLLSAILGKDYLLDRAFGGDEAIDMFLKKSYGLILMDVKMPRMDGIEAITEIRKVSHTIPIIVQTAYAFSSDRERAFAAGCNDFITKPVRAKELRDLVAKYFRN